MARYVKPSCIFYGIFFENSLTGNKYLNSFDVILIIPFVEKWSDKK